ncbi:MAG: hypothetical protein IPH35_20135 [Rhodoferax sp.]|nr:hypothetical protein [Rhodoferax sp.]
MSKTLRDGFRLIIATMLAFVPFVAHAGEWIADAKTACQVWSSNPSPGESISWSGTCSDGKATGTGTLQWYLNGKPNGRYEGEYRDGLVHGKGTYVLANGNRYEGEYRDGKMHGKGTYVEANGGRYEGEYRDGLVHGKGTYVRVNGDRYEGDWRDGKEHGKGAYVWANGDRYEGECLDGKMHGFGVMSLVRDSNRVPSWKQSGKGQWVAEKYVVQGMWENNRLIRECPSKAACEQLATAKVERCFDKGNAFSRGHGEGTRQPILPSHLVIASGCQMRFPGDVFEKGLLRHNFIKDPFNNGNTTST